MRKQLANDASCDVITYGYNAHYLDVQISGVKDHITQVCKYIRNIHLPGAWYKTAGGTCLVLPADIHWNSLSDRLQSYLDNWSVLVKVCDEHQNDVDRNIIDKVQNINLERQAEDYLHRMKPTARAVDRSQSNCCTITSVVNVWKELSDVFSSQPEPV